MLSPERLIEAWLGSERAAICAAISSDPFHVPYDQLAGIDGWIVWLGHPPVADGAPLLPLPERLLWDDPQTAIAASLLVAADYAVRRGATSAQTASAILARECPFAFVVPDTLHSSIEQLVTLAGRIGVPIVRRSIASADELCEAASCFRMRSRTHRVDLGRRHDPALSFQHHRDASVVGGNTRSIFFVHNGGERDQVSIDGITNIALGIEIGLDSSFSIADCIELETKFATIPSFLDGVSSWPQSDSLAIGWSPESPVVPETIGEVFRVYLKELYGARLVDLRIVFAPEQGGSSALSEMRSRESVFCHGRSSLGVDAARVEIAD